MSANERLLPKYERLLTQLGENLRLARLRRDLTTSQVAERADISRSTLYLLEKGEPGTSLGNFLRVLAVLGLDNDLAKVAADDELGRKLMDAALGSRERASKKTKGKNDGS